jgi:hypothetical protein
LRAYRCTQRKVLTYAATAAFCNELFISVPAGDYLSATAAYSVANKLVGDDGNNFSQSQRVGAFNVPINVQFKQTQKTVNLRYLHVFKDEYAGAMLGFTFVGGYIEKSRQVGLFPQYPTPGPAQAARNALQGSLSNSAAQQSISSDGLSDAEVGAVMTWDFEKSKLAASIGVSLPIGSYDSNRFVNAGFGNFYTVKPSIAYGYVFDNGLQLGGRLLYGANTRNKDTNYKTGDFLIADVVAMYKVGTFNLGLNLYQTQQLSSDNGFGVAASGNKIKLNGTGLTTALPTDFGGIEFKYIQDLSGKNTRLGKTFSVRLTKIF